MTYTVSVGLGGFNGWTFLKRTEVAQKTSIQVEPQIQKSQDAFISGFSNIKDADSLISDYKLLNVALTAFGLDSDIKNKAFIKKILESDLTNEKSFANRLNDRRYVKLAEAMGLGQNATESNRSSLEHIFEKFTEQTFETRVGQQDPLLRYALQARRELPELASKDISTEAFWYTVLGSKQLREVFDTAFSLPKSFGKLPIDRQLNEYMTRAEKTFGDSSPKKLTDPDNVEKLITSFLLRSQIGAVSTNSPYSTALAILTAR